MKKCRRKITAVWMLLSMVAGLICPQLPAEAASDRVVTTDKIGEHISAGSAYSGNWVERDRDFLYQMGGKLHLVTVRGKSLKDYTFDGKYNVRRTKKVTLPKYGEWGGFYHSPKGQNYVAIGYDNKKESTSKTVIKVMQFSKDWKKMKTANIKGGVSNVFEGIYIPFKAGNVSFAENDGTLYLFTARQMFKHDDGLRHQSNIGFSIDTKSMEAEESNPSYCSHSFNQIARFKDDELYLVDHGDAYPRAVQITIASDYKGAEARSGESVDTFPFSGDTGDNYTGAEITGMEVSGTHILITGRSVLQGLPKSSQHGTADPKNLILISKKRDGGGTGKEKWFTEYHYGATKSTVTRSSMVKISDKKLAILYAISDGGELKSHCMFIDGTGKKLSDKVLSNVSFKGGCQPIVFKNKIVFMYTDSIGGGTKINIISAK